MAQQTHIQWTDATWNVAVGCTKVDDDCKYCYVYRQSLNGTRYEPRSVRKTKSVFHLPLRLKKPSRIFTSSLTDVFHPDIDPYRHEMWDIIRACPRHEFQILTKRPERINEVLPPDWGAGWDHVLLGTSVGSQKATRARLWPLLDAPAKCRFLSIEPLWSPIDFSVMHDPATGEIGLRALDRIDWIILGGESGNEVGKYRYRECRLEWIESIVEQCLAHGVPVFIKQMGTYLAKKMGLKDRHGGDIQEWPQHLRLRQFPISKSGLRLESASLPD